MADTLESFRARPKHDGDINAQISFGARPQHVTVSFFSNLLQFYGLQLHHILPNSLVSIAGYAALWEGYLGILPIVDLFHLFFSVRPNVKDDESL
jgi:hypothetical protein